MGFGYLFIGYLLSFVIYITAQGIHIGGLMLLLGYGVMFYALSVLCRYQKAFLWAKWLLAPLALTAVYSQLASFGDLFLWKLPFVTATVHIAFDWATFLLLVCFNFALLYGIRMLATDVELPHIATKAVRNMLFVALYALLYVVAKLPFVSETAAQYLTLATILCDIVWIVCNLLLIISCAKNICPAGDEDQPAKPYRIGWLNRIGEAYSRNRQKAIDDTTKEAEEYLRRRKEKRESKQNRKKKK